MFLSVHPNESLEGALAEMLKAPGKAPEDASSIELVRTFDLAEERNKLSE